MSNRLDRNHGQIIDQSNFFLQERLSIFYAAQHPVKPRHGADALTNLGVSREVAATGLLISKLRFVSIDGFQPGFELVSDVYDKCRPDVVVERCINDFERAMRAAYPFRVRA